MLNGQGMDISGVLLGQRSVRDRDLGFAPAIASANPPTQRCELAELDYGHGLKWGLFPYTRMPLSGVSAVVYSCK